MLPKDILARYIHGSNALDGITLSEEQTLELVEKDINFSSNEDITAPDGNVYESGIVTGHRAALEKMLDFAKTDGEVSEELIRDLHRELMGALILSAGDYRECALRIKGLLIASPPNMLEDRMAELVKLIKLGFEKASNMDQLSWRVHHEFFTVHPFIEGNGRMARLLLNLIRVRSKLGLAILAPQDRERYGKAIIEFQKQKIQRARTRAESP